MIICIALFMAANILVAQVPERNVANVKKYTKICREHIYRDMKGMYREAGEALPYPFLAPGSAQYNDVLWDWDSWRHGNVLAAAAMWSP